MSISSYVTSAWVSDDAGSRAFPFPALVPTAGRVEPSGQNSAHKLLCISSISDGVGLGPSGNGAPEQEPPLERSPNLRVVNLDRTPTFMSS